MPKRQEHLNDRDKAILGLMNSEIGYYIKAMAEMTDLDQRQVRRTYRKLRRMGLAIYTTLWNEDEGTPAGSGYILTGAGVTLQDIIECEAAQKSGGINSDQIVV